MSDPVKSSEIEDVLASIRRLVSEEARSEMQTRRQGATQPEDAPETAKAPAPETVAEGEAPAAAALVLTPALRVHEGGRTEPELRQPEKALSEEVPQTEAPGPSAEASDHAHPAAEHAETDTLDEWPPLSPDDGAGDEASEDDPAEDISAGEDLPEPPAAPQSLETKIAALEALIAGSNEARKPAEDTVEAPPAAAQDETVEEWVPEAPVEDHADDRPETTVEATLDWQDHQPDVVEEEVAERPEAAEDMPLDPEVAELRDIDSVIQELAAQEPETTTSAQAEPAVEDPETAQEAPAVGALPIDEAALRELVIDIVREELQGALGERITRNVRRLVRREIHRALATQELD